MSPAEALPDHAIAIDWSSFATHRFGITRQ